MSMSNWVCTVSCCIQMVLWCSKLNVMSNGWFSHLGVSPTIFIPIFHPDFQFLSLLQVFLMRCRNLQAALLGVEASMSQTDQRQCFPHDETSSASQSHLRLCGTIPASISLILARSWGHHVCSRSLFILSLFPPCMTLFRHALLLIFNEFPPYTLIRPCTVNCDVIHVCI